MDFEATGLSNDERGWIMTALSGIACVFGASVICVDLIIRQFPGKKDFRIQDSDVFLSTSLSLSFGVMVCRSSGYENASLTDQCSSSPPCTACSPPPKAP